MSDVSLLLKKIGLQDKEIKVYLNLLENGSCSVRELSNLTSINRGTTYDVLKNLIKKGLVSYYDKKKKRHFVSEDPEKIKDYFYSKYREFEKLSDEINSLVLRLKSIEKLENKPIVKFYEGDKGIRSILLDVINSFKKLPIEKREYYVFSSYNIRKFLYKSFKDFTKKRIKNNIFVKVIAIGEGGKPQKFSQRKWILKQKKGTPTYKIIYDNKVALISLIERKLIGVLIDDKNLYETEKFIFETLWKKI